jgi:hypothetical protein
MGLPSFVPMALVIGHFICTWIYLGIMTFSGGSIVYVPIGLWSIVTVQIHGLLFWLKMTHEHHLHSLLNVLFYILAFLNMVLLIIVSTWAGVGNGARVWAAGGAAISFAVFDFLINAAMIAIAFLHPKSEGGGYTPPPQVVVTTSAGH